MIPTFPEFKKLELADKKDVEKFTAKFTPYADFNFSNMWAWDLKGEMGFSILNDNLVVKFTDYLNGKSFLSFLGNKMINETAKELIDFSEKNYKTGILKLVPETVVGLLDKSEFDFISDLDSRDYVYSVLRLASMDAWPQNTISKGVRRFIKQYPDYVIKQQSFQDVHKDEYLKMFKKWSENKNIINYSELNEYQAFERLLEIKDKNIKVISLYVKEVLVGFSVFEILADDYAMSHFAKADTSYHLSAYDILDLEEAKILQKQGIKYYNWQQDLGIQGLRKAKIKYKPDSFLNKFLVKKTGSKV